MVTKNLRLIAINLIFTLCISSPTFAFPIKHGPFFSFEKYSIDLKACGILDLMKISDRPRETKIIYGEKGAPQHPRLVLFAGQYKGFAVQILSSEGDVLVPMTHVSEAPGFLYPDNIYCLDLNGDNRSDFVVTLSHHGNGLAACFHDRVVILSSMSGFKIWVVPTMCPSPEDFIRLVTSRNPVLVKTTYAHNRAIVKNESKWHSYWVYNLIEFKGGELTLANHLDPRFPKWVWYTNKENHQPVRSLSDWNKKRMLDELKTKAFFNKIIY